MKHCLTSANTVLLQEELKFKRPYRPGAHVKYRHH